MGKKDELHPIQMRFDDETWENLGELSVAFGVTKVHIMRIAFSVFEKSVLGDKKEQLKALSMIDSYREQFNIMK